MRIQPERFRAKSPQDISSLWSTYIGRTTTRIHYFFDTMEWDLRKVHLFACACCRVMQYGLSNSLLKHIGLAEDFADGKVDKQNLLTAHFTVDESIRQASTYSEQAIYILTNPSYDLVNAIIYSGNINNKLAHSTRTTRWFPLDRQGKILYNFLDQGWVLQNENLTSTVAALAKQMYESRDFSALPILADALQDSGCDDEGILNWCRYTEFSFVFRGCWFIDLLLGKA